MCKPFVIQEKFTAAQLLKLSKIELVDMLINSRQLLKKLNIDLHSARVVIADNQQSIEAKRVALQRSASRVSSLRKTVKRRRKVSHG
jgi:hypothetical protein